MILQPLFLGSVASGVYATQPMCGVYATRLSVRLCQSAAVCASMPVSPLLGVHALQLKSPLFPWQYVRPWDAADHAHSSWSKTLCVVRGRQTFWRLCLTHNLGVYAIYLLKSSVIDPGLGRERDLIPCRLTGAPLWRLCQAMKSEASMPIFEI